MIASALLSAASCMAHAQPPELLMIVREPILPGEEATYETIETETAAACVALKCPHPHLALEPLTGPREVWWLNLFASDAELARVTRAYEDNAPLMEVLRRNSERKKKHTGEITEDVVRHRADLSRGARWSVAGARFLVVAIAAEPPAGEITAFQAGDGRYFAVQPVATREEAERLAGEAGGSVLAIRPSWGLPAPEWIAADRELWSANPAVHALPSARGAANE